MKYLNLDGVSKLWEKSVAKFALKSHTHPVATTSDDGFMSKSDKLKLNRLENTDYPLPITKGGTGAGTLSEATLNLMSRGTVTDANEVKDIGYYTTDTSTTNLPVVESYGILTVVRVGYAEESSWIIQYWSSTVDNKTQVYMRKNINNQGFKDWYQIQGNDEPVSLANGGTGGTKLEDAQKNLLDGTYPAEGTDLSKFAPGIYCLPNDSNTIANVPATSWSPLAFVFGHQNNDTAADGSPTGGYFQGYLDWEGELWLRRRKWDGWGEWMKYYSTKNIIYSSTQPSNPSTGTIWLKPI